MLKVTRIWTSVCQAAPVAAGAVEVGVATSSLQTILPQIPSYITLSWTIHGTLGAYLVHGLMWVVSQETCLFLWFLICHMQRFRNLTLVVETTSQFYRYGVLKSYSWKGTLAHAFKKPGRKISPSETRLTKLYLGFQHNKDVENNRKETVNNLSWYRFGEHLADNLIFGG